MANKPPTKQQVEREAHRLFWEELWNALPQEFKDRFEVTGKNELSLEVEPFGQPKWVSVTSKARTTMPGDKDRPYCGVTAAAEYMQEVEIAAKETAAKAKKAASKEKVDA